MTSSYLGNQISHKEILRLIVDELAGVVLTDAQGRYVYVNNRWSAVTGLGIESVRGKYVRDVMPDSMVDHVLRTGDYITKGISLKKAKTDAEIPIYCSYTPLYKNEVLVGCFIYMIIKSETEPMMIPTNIEGFVDGLDSYLQRDRPSRRTKYTIHSIIGESAIIQKMKDDIYKASRTLSSILIEGETGSGKELVAHAIHDLGERSSQPFIKVNCAAIPGELLESEFFGYETGAFTGAKIGGKIGKFQMADHGTLFLDEINQMSVLLQPKFLRVIQDRGIERVGGTGSIPVDIRIIVASNVPLGQLAEENKFRRDLYYRLNVLRIRVPPLRERKSDIPAIVGELIRQLNFQMGLQVPGIDGEAVRKLMEYDWPGNVRELRNVIERGMNFAWCEPLEWKHFENYFENCTIRFPCHGESRQETQKDVWQARSEAEHTTLLEMMRRCAGNKSRMARELGISRTALYKKLHKHGL